MVAPHRFLKCTEYSREIKADLLCPFSLDNSDVEQVRDHMLAVSV